MLTFHIHGRDYRVPPALEPEPAHCQAFHDAIVAQLHAQAAAAGIPKATVERVQFTPDGAYQYDADGHVVTVAEQHWLDLPPALHDEVVIPSADSIQSPPTAPAALLAAPTPDEED